MLCRIKWLNSKQIK